MSIIDKWTGRCYYIDKYNPKDLRRTAYGCGFLKYWYDI